MKIEKGTSVGIIGRSGSGKSTLASALESELYAKNIHSKLLDGDNLRTGINSNLGFSETDRTENIRRAAEISNLFVENGEVVICSLISPTNAIRKMAKEIIGEEAYREIYVNASFEQCAERDVKGLYKKARSGLIPNFTGISSPYEEPNSPDIEIDTTKTSPKDSAKKIIEFFSLKELEILSKKS